MVKVIPLLKTNQDQYKKQQRREKDREIKLNRLYNSKLEPGTKYHILPN